MTVQSGDVGEMEKKAANCRLFIGVSLIVACNQGAAVGVFSSQFSDPVLFVFSLPLPLLLLQMANAGKNDGVNGVARSQ